MLRLCPATKTLRLSTFYVVTSTPYFACKQKRSRFASRPEFESSPLSFTIPLPDVAPNIVTAGVEFSLHSCLVLWSSGTLEVARLVGPAAIRQSRIPIDLPSEKRCYSLSGARVDPTTLLLGDIPVVTLSRSSRAVYDLRARELCRD